MDDINLLTIFTNSQSTKISVKELRRYKIFQLSVFDLSTAWIGTWLFFWFIGYNLNPLESLILSITLGIIIHYILGIKTPLNTKLGL